MGPLGCFSRSDPHSIFTRHVPLRRAPDLYIQSPVGGVPAFFVWIRFDAKKSPLDRIIVKLTSRSNERENGIHSSN
jgi:hypothetical protein